MSRLDTLADALFGRTRAESQSVLTSATTRTYIGVATSDSADGVVEVTLAGDETLAEDTGATESYGHIQFATSPAVRKGDTVIVTLVGSGALKTPMVTGVAGSGDAQAGAIAAAQDAADAARAVANAINQHFWADSSGVHVSTEESDPEGTQNVLLNALGMLFRAGANNLLSVVTGNSPGVQIYDGAGNAASNIVANFARDLIELGKGSASAVIKLCSGIGQIVATTSPQGGIIVSYGANGYSAPSLSLFGLVSQVGTGGGGVRLENNWIDANNNQHDNTVAMSNGPNGASVGINTRTFDLSADNTYVSGYGHGTGKLLPMGTASKQITTQPSDGADVSFTLSSMGISTTDTNYHVVITPEDAPAGFTHVSYAVTDKTTTGFKVHAYNDYSAAITQTISVIVMHE